uniref:CSON011100 protein n=1 Tax=Culicoides sonorensis TaxID=179676 RepID=A0A336LMG1_CULSO
MFFFKIRHSKDYNSKFYIIMDLTTERTRGLIHALQMDKDNTKILAMLALGGGSLIFGLLPAFFTRTNRRRQPLIISNLLCFGAGVLLATSLIHMLPEVREKLPNYPELIFCGGFFMVYVADELLHLICGEAIRHTHTDISAPPRRHSNTHQHDGARPCGGHNYGAMSETQSLLDDSSEHYVRQEETIRQIEERADAEANSRICHTNHREPCEQSLAGHAGLLFALSLHSILEGIAVGVQDTSAKVLLLLGAVACHKFVVGFCLGVELSSTPGARFRNQLLAILIFSFGSILGIGIGMAIVDLKTVYDTPALQVLQALAGGTLLYVTVCEVLPREKARWHLSDRKYAGITQCLSVLIGFGTMTMLSIFMSK